VEKALASLPIRFECHSHNHNPHDTDSEKELDESITWYEKFFGHPPKGYRAPNGLISRSGLTRLAERGFVYDSSIFPSLRFDEYSYNHFRLPIHPYVVRAMGRTLIELPLAVIRRIRLVVSVSHIKLLGWRFYDPLIQLFGLPDVVIINSHPYDYFVRGHLHRIPGWKRWAHARNADNALPFLERLLRTLKSAGYTFLYIDDLLRVLDPREMTQVEISEI
jgi:peptidoglycan/xylan/chitin deacetylase (PgdA/CDA1 family)